MKFSVYIDGQERTLEIERVTGENGSTNRMRAILDGRTLNVDAVETSPGAISILIGATAYEARVVSDGRDVIVTSGRRDFRVQLRDTRAWRRAGAGTIEAEGRQQVRAPMPGKVIRVLVSAGDTVESGQGLLVVEAMKMQNEIRAPKSGVVERVSAKEGQAVSAGESLVVIS
jgi:biotin carboxyl carrier protein